MSARRQSQSTFDPEVSESKSDLATEVEEVRKKAEQLEQLVHRARLSFWSYAFGFLFNVFVVIALIFGHPIASVKSCAPYCPPLEATPEFCAYHCISGSYKYPARN